jgi:hypothetical protein
MIPTTKRPTAAHRISDKQIWISILLETSKHELEIFSHAPMWMNGTQETNDAEL